ncbi:SCO6880 family protein [Nocardia rhamnosiphila]
MTTTQPSAQPVQRTYGMWTRPRNEGLWGLGWAVTMAGFVAIVIAMLAVMAGGFMAGAVIGVLEIVVLVPMAVRVGGRTGYERGIQMFQFMRTRLRREHIYASGVFSKLGTCKLPGILAESKLYEDLHSSGMRFAMVHVPAHDLYTVVLRCWPQGARAVDQSMIDHWVASWGRLMADLGGAPDIEAIIPVIDTTPETGNRLAAEVTTLTRSNAPDMAKDMMAELQQTLPSNTVRLDSWCSVMFRATTPERRKDPAEQAREIGRRLPGLIGSLSHAGVRARPMTGDELTALMRRAWDPASEADLEAAADADLSHGLSWSDAGPVAYEEYKDRLWHDGTLSVTWEMSVAPEGNVYEDVLKELLEPKIEVPRKRVALVLRPHSGADATKIVDSDYKNALMAEQSARGVVSAHARMRVGATEQAREEQARGHGVTRFGILITVTEPADGADLPRVDAITRDLSVQARLRIRRCYRYQAAAFSAGLGTGVLLPEMSSVPRAVAE